jgi:hypothetical protein
MALPGRRPLRPVIYVALVTVLFFGLIGFAKVTGHWKSDVTYEEYKTVVPMADKFEHP